MKALTMTDDLPSTEQQEQANEALAPQRDPGPAVVDKILDGLEEFADPPAEVARKARRLRAHIAALREVVSHVPIDSCQAFVGCNGWETPDEVWDGLLALLPEHG
jgi:hypothetical protein